jgi:hypothetical protein
MGIPETLFWNREADFQSAGATYGLSVHSC